MKNLIERYESLLADKQERLRKGIADSDIEREGLQDSEVNRIKLAVLEAEAHILSDVLRDLTREE
jgi:hypothetical protein